VVFPLASSQPAVSVDVVIILPEVIIRNEQPGVAYSGKKSRKHLEIWEFDYLNFSFL
jgi:hypothetical protein